MMQQADWRLVTLLTVIIPFFVWKTSESMFPIERTSQIAIPEEDGQAYDQHLTEMMNLQYITILIISLVFLIVAIVLSFNFEYGTKTIVSGMVYGSLVTVAISIVWNYHRLTPISIVIIMGLFLVIVMMFPVLFPKTLLLSQ